MSRTIYILNNTEVIKTLPILSTGILKSLSILKRMSIINGKKYDNDFGLDADINLSKVGSLYEGSILTKGSIITVSSNFLKFINSKDYVDVTDMSSNKISGSFLDISNKYSEISNEKQLILNELEEVRNKLREDNQNFISNKEIYQTRISQLQQQNLKLTEAENEVLKIKNEELVIIDESEKFKKQLVESESRLIELQSKLDKLDIIFVEFSKMKAGNEVKGMNIKKLLDKIADSVVDTSEIEVVKESINLMIGKINDDILNSSEIIIKLSETEEKVNEVMDAYKHIEEIDKIKDAKIQTLETEKHLIEEKVDLLLVEKQSVKSTIDKLSKEISSLMKQKESLFKDLKGEIDIKNVTKDEISKLTQELERIIKENEETKVTIDKLKFDILKIDGNGNVDSESLLSNISSLLDEKQTANKSIEELNKQILSLLSSKEVAEKNIESLLVQVSDLMTNKELLETKMTSMSEIFHNLELENEKSLSKINMLLAKLDEVTRENNENKVKVKVLSNTIDGEDGLMSNYKLSIAENLSLKSQIKLLSDDIKDANTKNELLMHDFTLTVEKFAHVELSLKEEIKAKNDEIAFITESLESVAYSHRMLEDDTFKIKSEFSIVDSELQSAKRKLEEIKDVSSHEMSKEVYEEMKSLINELSLTLKEMSEDLDKEKQLTTKLQKDVDIYEDEFEKQKSHNKFLQEKIDVSVTILKNLPFLTGNDLSVLLEQLLIEFNRISVGYAELKQLSKLLTDKSISDIQSLSKNLIELDGMVTKLKDENEKLKLLKSNIDEKQIKDMISEYEAKIAVSLERIKAEQDSVKYYKEKHEEIKKEIVVLSEGYEELTHENNKLKENHETLINFSESISEELTFMKTKITDVENMLFEQNKKMVKAYDFSISNKVKASIDELLNIENELNNIYYNLYKNKKMHPDELLEKAHLLRHRKDELHDKVTADFDELETLMKM